MDLFENFKKTYDTLRVNLLLFLPPLIIAYLIPVALFITAAYAFIPIFAQTARTGSSTIILLGAVISAILLLIAAFVMYASVFVGWGYMNRSALTSGRTNFEKFREGFVKYFFRVLGATVMIVGVLVVIGITAFVSVIAVGGKLGKLSLTTNQVILLLRQSLTTGTLSGIPINPQGLIASSTKFTVGVSATILFFVTLAGVWLLFTTFWIPAIVVSDTSLFHALSQSFTFVKENFYTVIGFVGLWIIADRFARTIFPGSTGVAKGTVIVMPSALGGVFQVLIQAFFILLLYSIYVDRAKSAPTPKQGT